MIDEHLETNSTSTTLGPGAIRFSLFNGCRNNKPMHFSWFWEQLISPDGLGKVREVHGATRDEAKSTLLAVSPAFYPPDTPRGDQYLEGLQLFMLDFDNKAEQPTGETKESGEPMFQKVPIVGAPTLDEVHQHLQGLGITHFGYHSFSSRPDCERFRIVIPLAQVSDGKNWKAVSECLLARLQMDHWRDYGCIDLGAMHRAAGIYFVAGYWSGDPEAKERIRFVSHLGHALDLPTPEEIAQAVVKPAMIHPLRRAWIEQKAAQRNATVEGSPEEWFKPFNVDFPTLDIVGLVRDMGSEVHDPVSHGTGWKARCTCPMASEHTEGLDHGDAAVFYGPDKWPGFHCMHAVHEGVGLREICLEAGPDLVQRHAKHYRLVSSCHASAIQPSEAIEAELLDEDEDADLSDKERAARTKAKWSAVLEDHGVEPGDILFNSRGQILKCRSNLEAILGSMTDFQGGIRLNQMTNTIEVRTPERDYLELDDLGRNLTSVRIYLERTFRDSWSGEAVSDVVDLVAARNAYHPVMEHLQGLPQWDGLDRFPLLVEEVLAAGDTPDFEAYRDLYNEYMRCTCIAAVRRVFEPGCKMDTVTILYGDQAALKSTFWKTLAVNPGWFNDSKIQVDHPEGMKVLHHAWIHELGEIDDMTYMKPAEVIKAFVSSATDTFRESYGKAPKAHPRRSIIVASTNKEQVLNDPTGSRRFWVIPVGKRCDLDLLRTNLEQIWAQALYLYREGAPHFLTPELEALRVAQSGRHQVENRFADLLPKILDFYLSAPRPKGITLNEIFSYLEGKQEEGKGFAKPNNAERRDLGACLRAAGWSVKSNWVNGASSKCFTPPGDHLLHPAAPEMPPTPWEGVFPAQDPALIPYASPDRPLLL